jgi:peptidoglycan/xylan/chitin deacetylase (PgdA/CDA1 family)
MLLTKIALIILLFSFPHASPDIIILSFDTELPDTPEVMTPLLDLLEEYDAHATFFVTGEFAQKYPQTIIRMRKEGHEVGCHGTTHHAFPTLSTEEQRQELRGCKDALEEVDITPIGFRAPYRMLAPSTLRVLKEEGFRYDASLFGKSEVLFPVMDLLPVEELPTSAILFLPLDDYTLLRMVHLPTGTYEWLLLHAPGRVVSLSFHPHHIMAEQDVLEKVLTQGKEKGVAFRTFEEVTSSQARASSP